MIFVSFWRLAEHTQWEKERNFLQRLDWSNNWEAIIIYFSGSVCSLSASSPSLLMPSQAFSSLFIYLASHPPSHHLSLHISKHTNHKITSHLIWSSVRQAWWNGNVVRERTPSEGFWMGSQRFFGTSLSLQILKKVIYLYFSFICFCFLAAENPTKVRSFFSKCINYLFFIGPLKKKMWLLRYCTVAYAILISTMSKTNWE